MSKLGELTERQKQIVALALEGYSDKEIALILKCSWRTVTVHKEQIKDRLGLPRDHRRFSRCIRSLMAREEEDRRLKA